jgi:hypothetical protein
MKQTAFEKLLEEVGPFALNTVLYNYGEPLLNKNIADFVLAANGYGLSSWISSNISMRFDVERFILAVPTFVIAAIDGVTQETYSRYRRRGDLALVLDNLRRMVETKKRHGLGRPILAWQFLTFEHNVHEVDAAIELAKRMGIDQIRIITPFSVAMDDPDIRALTSERCGVHEFIPATHRNPDRSCGSSVATSAWSARSSKVGSRALRTSKSPAKHWWVHVCGSITA